MTTPLEAAANEIAEALEDEYGTLPPRYKLELTYGVRIGGAIHEVATWSRIELMGRANAAIPGFEYHPSTGDYTEYDIHVLTDEERSAMGIRGGEYAFVDLDWASDSDPADKADTIAALIDADGSRTAWARGLHSAVIDPCGPGGGWPIVRFTGTLIAITELVRAYSNEG